MGVRGLDEMHGQDGKLGVYRSIDARLSFSSVKENRDTDDDRYLSLSLDIDDDDVSYLIRPKTRSVSNPFVRHRFF